MVNPETATLETFFASLVKRLSATINLTASTAQLAAAELKLAMSSAGLMVVGVIALCVMLFCTWLLALFTAFQALLWTGLAPVTSAAVMLLGQIGLCLGIVLVLFKLRRNCAFKYTREALAHSFADDTSAALKPPPTPTTHGKP